MKKSFVTTVVAATITLSSFLCNSTNQVLAEENVINKTGNPPLSTVGKFQIQIPDQQLEKAILNQLTELLDRQATSNDLVQSNLDLIQTLWLKGDIKSLEGLQYLRNIKELTLKYMDNVDSLSYLKYLNKLTHFGMIHTVVHDKKSLSVLNNLVYLKNIFIDHAGDVNDLGDLDHLPNLESIHISSSFLDKNPGLTDSIHLKELSLRDTDIQHYSHYSQFTQLEEVNLDGNQLKEVPDFSSNLNLTALRLQNNQIEDISNLKHFSNIRSMVINLDQNLITENNPIFNDFNFLSSYRYNFIPNRDAQFKLSLLEDIMLSKGESILIPLKWMIHEKGESIEITADLIPKVFNKAQLHIIHNMNMNLNNNNITAHKDNDYIEIKAQQVGTTKVEVSYGKLKYMFHVRVNK
ncbi:MULTISPECIES: leucine-rich repeat domain-containing protein [Bacillus cereus group]|uniref:leucine-rich repeat domain-containing protein n=1 Tax=Bacillus cereus group TaxID=86661 RepID=UPI000A3D50CC|nr:MULTISPECIES: leucine-rich repeat domain-containing protein [Bacillus cereus group]MCU5601238.1 leucine-rich repeat domain-containing protein [Bacillus wiedmannii]OUB75135.1 hypothetical protein BK744_13105 [Bacillus thuringiensis serovar zhaodongensis]